MKKEHIKSFILILLILNSLQLTLQLWFDSNLWPGGFGSIANNSVIRTVFPFIRGTDSDMDEEKLYIKATQPRRVIVNGGGAREVYIFNSEEYTAALEMAVSIIDAMKETGVTVRTVSYEDWKNLFKGKSLYIDYGFSFDSNSLNKLYGAVSSQGKFEQFTNSSGFIITPDTVTNICTITVLDETDNTVYEHRFSCDGTNLLKFIEDMTYGKQQNDTFAFEINLDTSSDESENVERKVELSPLTLLLISADMTSEKNIVCESIFENAWELEKFAERTLPVFGYNPSSLRKTVQSNGTIVYVENNATIKYYFDGTIEYSAVSKERGLKKSDTASDCNQAINDVLKVVKELWSESGMDGNSLNLHLDSSVIDSKTNRYTVKFNNIYNGIVIDYDNVTPNAVYAEVEDGYITNFKIHLVNISESEETSRIMPVLEAIDKMYAGYGDSKVIIDDVYKCYDIKRDRNVSAKWAFKIRGTDEILVIDNAGDV